MSLIDTTPTGQAGTRQADQGGDLALLDRVTSTPERSTTQAADKTTQVANVAAVDKTLGKTTKSPVDVVFSTFSAVGADRPLSNLAGLGTAGMKTVLKKFPGASRILTPLLDLMPKGAKAGAADPIRLEVNTSLTDKSSVLHVKLNLSQFIKLGEPNTEKAFKLLLANASTPAQKAEILAFKRIVDTGSKQPGFADSNFAKTTNLRITFDPVKLDGFRVGMMTLPVMNKFGQGGTIGAIGISPRMKFDAQGKPSGFQILVGYQVETPPSKNGFWGGIGAGVLVQWNGGIDNSPIRKNSQGQLGIEINLGGTARFMPVPGLRDTVQTYQMGDLNKVKLSSAPAVSSKDIATNLLKTDDPNVIASLKKGAEIAEQTANVVDTAVNIAGTVSQVSGAAAAVAGISVPAILAAAALAIPIVLAWQDGLADGTLEGHRRQIYKNDAKVVNDALQVISPLLQYRGDLNAEQRAQLGAALGQLKAVSRKWATTPDLKTFFDKLPANEKLPIAPRQVAFLEQKAALKGVQAQLPAGMYQIKMQLNQVLSSTTQGALTNIEQLPSWIRSKQYSPQAMDRIQAALSNAVSAGSSGRVTDWTQTLSAPGRAALQEALKLR